MTKIEWTDATWNPVTGCAKCSAGCKFCYAAVMAKRLQAMGQPKYRNGFEVTLHPQELDAPVRWRAPRMVFVCSMADLFHDEVPEDYIARVFATMASTPQHTYQVLTKRSGRLRGLSARLPWPANVWVGVSVENDAACARVDDLRAVPAAVRFISAEPLLGPLTRLDLTGIGWLIAGGESGPQARPMAPEWVLDLRDRCRTANTAFFFKQWGGRNKKAAGRLLDGRTYDEFPSSRTAGAAS